MRKSSKAIAITTLIAGSLFSYPVWAGEKPTPEVHGRIVDICKEESNTAMRLMELRQKGVPMADLLIKAPNNYDELIYNNTIRIVYIQPRYSTDSYIKRAISDVGDVIFQHCYNDLIDRASKGNKFLIKK